MGKRSGNGFVAHKATLVNALGRVLADRVTVAGYELGRKGFAGYIKALSGSNTVKVIPGNGADSETHGNGKRLKVICGSTTSYLDERAWIGDNTPISFCEVRISPKRVIQPNIGSLELAEALNRVLPFTATEDNRPALQCVLFRASQGKLSIVSADGFRLAVVQLDYTGEGEALVHRDDLQGVANALRKAQRVNLSFDASGDSLDGTSLIIDTEIIRYKWRSLDGQFPEYQKLIPIEAKVTARIDTVEAGKAIASLKALADSKEYPIDLCFNGGIVMTSPDEAGTVTMPADVEGGELTIRIDGGYLLQALRACGGMVDCKLTDSKSPVLFDTEGYQLVVMPMMRSEPKPEAEAEATEPAPEPVTDDTDKAEAEATAPEAEVKPKRKRKREPVTV